MKEAIANAGVFNLIIIFVIILLAFFIGSLSYSRAFKAKNRIIEEIERDQGYTTGTNSTESRVEDWLGNIGYRYNTTGRNNCPTVTGNGGASAELVSRSADYEYCVYKFDTCQKDKDNAKCGTYYRVITYMYFDIPIISQLAKIRVSGETMIFNPTNDTSHLGHIIIPKS